ncbi:hypothetical protein LQZ44_11955 [Alcaligenes nematophilus]|uniref:hypothetical protein n=1 Tax=Alcaligenes nematophilus TaxID=2994643 RepID=UPI0035B5505B
MRFVAAIFSLLALTACANTAQVSTKLVGIDGLEISKTSDGANILESYTVSSDINEKADLPFCIASNLKNESVFVKGSATGHVGAYSGRYYQTESARTVGGGEVISYSSKDGDKVVATGTTEYNASMIVVRSVKFQLVATKQNGSVKLVFSPIEQAQLDTGVVENRGYFKIGAWDGAHPDKAVEAIQAEAQKIVKCLQE